MSEHGKSAAASGAATSGIALERREIGRVVGAEAGATLVVVAGIHGNEPAGIEAGRRVLDKLAQLGGRAEDALRGELVILAGNVTALRSGERYLERDLNRGWTDAHFARMHAVAPSASTTAALQASSLNANAAARLHDATAPGAGDAMRADPSSPLGPEDREQLELAAAIDGAVGRARGAAFLADLHTSSAAGVPFVLFRDDPDVRAFVSAFPIPVISGILEQVEGVLSEHAARRGCTSFSVEGGQHRADESRDALEAILWISLERAGMLAAHVEARAEVAHAQNVLDQMRGDLPHAVEVVSRHAITADDDFVMERGFRNIDRIQRGQLLARDRRGEVRAHEDGVVVLPLYQKLGQDGFFWGRERR